MPTLTVAAELAGAWRIADGVNSPRRCNEVPATPTGFGVAQALTDELDTNGLVLGHHVVRRGAAAALPSQQPAPSCCTVAPRRTTHFRAAAAATSFSHWQCCRCEAASPLVTGNIVTRGPGLAACLAVTGDAASASRSGSGGAHVGQAF